MTLFEQALQQFEEAALNAAQAPLDHRGRAARQTYETKKNILRQYVAALEAGQRPPNEIYAVIKFYGVTDILAAQKLDSIWFVKQAAEKRAARMEKRHNWIWRAIPVYADIDGTIKLIRAELNARGIDTTVRSKYLPPLRGAPR
jgi:hypothetical protein